jgi:hypothetical protein
LVNRIKSEKKTENQKINKTLTYKSILYESKKFILLLMGYSNSLKCIFYRCSKSVCICEVIFTYSFNNQPNLLTMWLIYQHFLKIPLDAL